MRSRTAFTCGAMLATLAGGLTEPNIAVAGDDVAELKRAIAALQAENRAMAKRLANLEAAAAAPAPRTVRQAARAAPPPNASPPTPRAAAPAAVRLPPAQAGVVAAADAGRKQKLETLDERVSDLEAAKVAQEDATRSIIRDSLSKIGPKVNEFVSLGGAIEVLAANTHDFTGPVKNTLAVSTAELDFDIKASEWATGSLVISYDTGQSVLFPTTEGGVSGVDRLTVDTATITIGDTERFPLFVKAGRDVIPFGTSTGFARFDSLSITNPLTIEGFETRKTLFGMGFAAPTPIPGPPLPPVPVPPVQPLVVTPLVRSLARFLGYVPSSGAPKPLVPTSPPPPTPPFYGSFNVYQANELTVPNPNLGQSISASLGAKTSGSCGRSFDQLHWWDFCPWSLDFHVDYNSSVFESNFLQNTYNSFLPQIGLVPGMAASLKASFGPVALTAEVDGALKPGKFVDDTGANLSVTPVAWQVSLGYQFDWNPWVEKIGEQGDFVAVTYSGTAGLAGAIRTVNQVPTRVGALPSARLSLTAGEWVVDGLKLAVEYSMDWDYGKKAGGTGGTANSVLGALTYNF